MLGLPYECVAVETDENLDSPLAQDPPSLAIVLAREKVRAARVAGTEGVILGFDTIVVHEGRLLGKPVDLEDAHRMLRDLSGTTHEVVTGVAVSDPRSSAVHTFAVRTPVRMRALTADEIDAWVAQGELLGCAGAYNIESHLAEVDCDQCLQNVAGLPLCHLHLVLTRIHEELGIDSPRTPVEACDKARGLQCVLGPKLMAELD